MGRGPGLSAVAGRIFWPSAAEAVARHNATKMNRRVILQFSQIAAKAELAMPRRQHRPTVQVSFDVGLEDEKRAKTLRLETTRRGTEQLLLRCLDDSRGCREVVSVGPGIISRPGLFSPSFCRWRRVEDAAKANRDDHDAWLETSEEVGARIITL